MSVPANDNDEFDIMEYVFFTFANDNYLRIV